MDDHKAQVWINMARVHLIANKARIAGVTDKDSSSHKKLENINTAIVLLRNVTYLLDGNSPPGTERQEALPF